MQIVIMRWEKESKQPEHLIDIPELHAMEIICDAYYERYINWNVYQKAMEKIKKNMNGNWMFEQKQNIRIF